ncbi:hypothetical protein BCR39DRAFT_69149 [Naematelia encephala]|uniref:Uncharacterized protein n=1 Tax=Naematelia encephala TaxID=71784 RepID=A0A1Y2BBK9_9TREE|nr:hypothetical protein BCR39DRAFT_69149 [Naematelia encephala]
MSVIVNDNPSFTVARCESTIPADSDTLIIPDINSDIEAAFVRKVLQMFREYRKEPTHSTTNLFAALEAAEMPEGHRSSRAESMAGHELVSPEAPAGESEKSSTPPATMIDLAGPEGLYSDKEEPTSPLGDRPALLPSRDDHFWRDHIPTRDVWHEQVNIAYPLTADRYLDDPTESTAEMQPSDWSDGTSSPLLAAVDPRCGLAHLDWKEEESDGTFGSAGYWSRQLSPDSPFTVSDKSDTPELDFGPSSLPPSSAIQTPRTPRTVRARFDSSSRARFRRQEKHALASMSPLKQKTRSNASMLAGTPEPDEGTLSRRPNVKVTGNTGEVTGSGSGGFAHLDSWSHLATSTSPGYRARNPTWRTYQGVDEPVESDEGSILFSSDEQDEVDESGDEDKKIDIADASEVVIGGHEDTLIFTLETDPSIPHLHTLGDSHLFNGSGAPSMSLVPIRWFSRDGGELALLERITDATTSNPRIMGASAFLDNPKRTHGIDGPVREPAHGMVYARKVLKIPPVCTEEVDTGSCHNDSHLGDAMDADSVDDLLSEDEEEDSLDFELGENNSEHRDAEYFKSEVSMLGRDFATRMIAHASHASNLACADP